MANENKKPEVRKPKFNSWWIIGGLALLLLGSQFFGGNSLTKPKKITPANFQKYMKDGDVEKVVIYNNRLAKVYLTKDAKRKEEHSSKTKKGILKPNPNDASYQFEIGDLQNFENDFRTLKAVGNLSSELSFETEENFFENVILPFLPFIVIIGIWIFIMRRMSSGGAGRRWGSNFQYREIKSEAF